MPLGGEVRHRPPPLLCSSGQPYLQARMAGPLIVVTIWVCPVAQSTDSANVEREGSRQSCPGFGCVHCRVRIRGGATCDTVGVGAWSDRGVR
jgi:hypothetical protein